MPAGKPGQGAEPDVLPAQVASISALLDRHHRHRDEKVEVALAKQLVKPSRNSCGGRDKRKGSDELERRVRERFCTTSYLKELRMARGLSNVKLSAFVGCSLETTRNAERGFVLRLQVGTLFRFATALDVGVADIWPIFGHRMTRASKNLHRHLRNLEAHRRAEVADQAE